MRMVFYCAKEYQEDLVDCQVTDADRAREQRDLDQIKRLEKLILETPTRTLQGQLTADGCPSLTIEQIKRLVDSGDLQSNNEMRDHGNEH